MPSLGKSAISKKKLIDKPQRLCYNGGRAHSVCPFVVCQAIVLREGDSAVEMLKNAASRVVGSKQVQRALKAGSLSRVYVAEDIDTFL